MNKKKKTRDNEFGKLYSTLFSSRDYKHLELNVVLLPSLYSWRLTHSCWNVPVEATIEPPTHGPKRLSVELSGADILILILAPTWEDISRFSLSEKPFGQPPHR